MKKAKGFIFEIRGDFIFFPEGCKYIVFLFYKEEMIFLCMCSGRGLHTRFFVLLMYAMCWFV